MVEDDYTGTVIIYNNPYMKELLKYHQRVHAKDIYEHTHDYMLKEFNKEDLTGLCLIRPDKLCELINNNYDILEDILYVIFVYKMQNNLDIGFSKETYLKEFKLYEEKHRKKKYRNNNKKIYTNVYETFDEYKDTTYEEYLEYLKNEYDIKIVEKLSFNSKDYTGFKIGKIEVLKPFKKYKSIRYSNYKDPAIWWICKCSCGSYYIERNNRIKRRKSCGKCADQKNYIGKRKGYLEVIDQKYWIRSNGYSQLMLQVKCDCGNIKIMKSSSFNKSKYCGKDCSMMGNDRAKSATEKQEFKKIFYNNTNIFKLDKKKETDINHNNTSGYLGVTLNKQTNKYLAYIYFQHKRYDLGYYNTASYASKVRQQAQAILYGEYAEVVKDDEFIKNNKYLTKLINKLIEEGKIKSNG